MKTAVLFGSGNSLDFKEVRQGLYRIPEISLRLEEAQCIWDKECVAGLSFQHFLTAENAVFFNNINVKALIHSIVQIGLFDRYKRKNRLPDFLIGNTKNDAALL